MFPVPWTKLPVMDHDKRTRLEFLRMPRDAGLVAADELGRR